MCAKRQQSRTACGKRRKQITEYITGPPQQHRAACAIHHTKRNKHAISPVPEPCPFLGVFCNGSTGMQMQYMASLTRSHIAHMFS